MKPAVAVEGKKPKHISRHAKSSLNYIIAAYISAQKNVALSVTEYLPWLGCTFGGTVA